MIPMSKEHAVKNSIEIAKILCESPNVQITPDASGANMLADFIETLQDRFTQNKESTE